VGKTPGGNPKKKPWKLGTAEGQEKLRHRKNQGIERSDQSKKNELKEILRKRETKFGKADREEGRL